MGGQVCAIIINSLVRYEEVPSNPAKRKELEAQLRQCYANPVIAERVGQDNNVAMTVCNVLEKEHLLPADLEYLLNTLPEYDNTLTPPS